MIGHLTIALAANQAVVVNARPMSEGDRVYAEQIALRCEIPLNGQTVALVAHLKGLIGGAGRGPIELDPSSDQQVSDFKSVSSMISWDEKLPLGTRLLDVSVDSKLRIAKQRYVANVHFSYAQDDVMPNRVYEADRVRNAKLSMYRAADMRPGYTGYMRRNSRVLPVAESNCVPSPSASGGATR